MQDNRYRGGRRGGRGGDLSQNSNSHYQKGSNDSFCRGRGRGGGRGDHSQNSNSYYQKSNNESFSRGRGRGGREGGGRGGYQGDQSQNSNSHYLKGNNENYSRGRGGRGGGRRGGRGDKIINYTDATKIMNKQLQDVFDARPKKFPEQPSGQSTRLTLRPNLVNEHKNIWRPVNTKLNLFLIKSKQQSAFQYDLQVHKSKADDAAFASREVFKKVFQKLKLDFQWPESTIHDGRSTIWAETKELEEMVKFPVHLEQDKRPYFVTFVFADKIDNLGQLQTGALSQNVRDIGFLVPQECIRLLDSALRHPAIHSEMYALRGRSIFDLRQKGESIGGEGVYEVLMGYRESVRVVREGLVLNINTVYNMARISTPLLDFLQFHGVERLDRLLDERTKRNIEIEQCLNGVKIKYELPIPGGQMQKRNKKIKCISDKSAVDEYICVNGKGMSVADYFWSQYQYKLKYPHLNLIDVSTPNSDAKIPLECCRVLEGQFERAEGKLQADLIRKAAKTPTVRYEDIEQALHNVESRIKETPANFWISHVKREWLQGVGSVIEAPIIQYGGKNNTCVQPRDGTWNGFSQTLGQEEYMHYGNPIRIDSWAVINSYKQDEGEVVQFCKSIVEFGRKVGMTIVDLPRDLILSVDFNHHSNNRQYQQVLGKRFEDAVKRCEHYFQKKPQIIFVPLDGASRQYDMVKGMLEGNSVTSPLKIPSQCLDFRKYRKKLCNDSYISNLMLKVNMKVGGSNYRLLGGEASIPTAPFSPNDRQRSQFFPLMIMGADVTHPKIARGSDDQGTSIAAVVASMDCNFVRYGQRVSSQKGKQEIIEKMEKCTADLLKEFGQRNGGTLPKTILFYRDGVSEGQFDIVLQSEYRAMKRAFQYFYDGGAYPTVTFITVQKRHHYRPQTAGDDGSCQGNLHPGTVIDHTGLHPCEFQFLLNSHKTIQGTNRPALYQVLVDEAQFGSEQLILLTYYLTYTYQRCSRSVSIPAPAYYAHHVCTRGRLLEQFDCDEDMFDAAVAGSMCWI
eukprot:TRINITY_DN3236_c0_g1_i6.p1 TRINITY_DN3236_c0_g1~~TRINITY_DN3236_c0_g1_i6.p1  ORF type:complete len:1017 (+),score=159.74 TRINITY_DN3236_c0_g1_i6:164-3214(+)